MAQIKLRRNAGLTWDDQRCFRCTEATLRLAVLYDEQAQPVASTVRCDRCGTAPPIRAKFGRATAHTPRRRTHSARHHAEGLDDIEVGAH